MNSEVLKSLLQELIDKQVSLEQSAKILWSLHKFLDIREDIAEYEAMGCEQEELAVKRLLQKNIRLDLDHYIVTNDIKSISIKNL